MKRYLLLLLFLTGTLSLAAQNFLSWQYSDRYFSATIGTGNNIYFGELNSANRIQQDLSHLSLGLEARLWSKVSARAEFAYYHIRGNDKFAADSSFKKQRNLSFKSNNVEGSLQGVFYLRQYRGDYYKRWSVDPYIALGVGFTTVNPYAEYEGDKIDLRPLQTEQVAYSPVAFMIPAAAGVKLRINEFVNINLELAYRYTFTDYLDDVSTFYPGELADPLANALTNRKDEIAIINAEAYDQQVAGGPRGNPNDNDQYLFLSVKFEVFLPRGSNSLFSKPGAY